MISKPKTKRVAKKAKRKRKSIKKLVDGSLDNKQQDARQKMILDKLKHIPTSYKSAFQKAWSTNSKKFAIKAMCLECTGYDKNYVRNCPSFACPLWVHRPYQKSDDVGED